MKINMTEELRKESLLSHVVMHGMHGAMAKEIGDNKDLQTPDGVVIEVDLVVNGHSIDLQLFCDHWQNQVGRIIKNEAKDLVKEKLSDIIDKLHEIDGRVDTLMEDTLEDWEKEKL